MARIGTQKIRTTAGYIEIPIYEIGDVEYPALKIRTLNGIGCYNLVPVSNETPIRVRTMRGIMGISTGPIASNSLIDPNNYLLRNGTVINSQNDEYFDISTSAHTQGIRFIVPIEPNKLYSVEARVEILTTVDDTLELRVWNATKGSYISTNLATGNTSSGIQTLLGSFNSGNMAATDVIEFWVVQRFTNGTHDQMHWKLYKDMILS